MREHPAGLLDVVAGQHLVALAPHHQGGSRVQGREGGQLPAPARPDAAGVGQLDRRRQHHRSVVRLGGDRHGAVDAFPGGQRRVGVARALEHPGGGAGVAAGAQRTDDRQRQDPQQRGDLGAEAGAVDQPQAGHPLRSQRQHLHGDRSAEGVAEHMHRPGLAECVDGAEHPFGESGQRDRRLGLIGEPEPGDVDGDHPVVLGEPGVLKIPVLQAAADPMDQHHRRVVRVTVDPDAHTSALHLDEGGPAHARAAPAVTGVRLAVLNRSAASSTGPLRSRAWSAQ